MASSSNDPDSLVTLRFHDFRVERMRHWWTLLGEDDHADVDTGGKIYLFLNSFYLFI